MKNIQWLEKFATDMKAKANTEKKTVKASKKVISKDVLANVDMIVLSKSVLPKAVEGNTVKYKSCKWKVVDASYKDAKGAGVVLEKVAGIDTKKLTDPEQRAYTDPGNVYDYNVREVSEIPDFQAAEAQTAKEIAKEDAVDHETTPDARYKNPVLMDNGSAEETPVEDAPAEEDFSIDEEVPEVEVEETVEETPVEEEVEETPDEVEVEETVEETPVEEEVVEEESPEEDFTFEDVDEEPIEEEKKDDKKKASAKKVNRIIAAMLK